MPLSLKLITGPTAEPVTLQMAKDHLRVADSNSDSLIQQYIASARHYCELAAHRAFFNQTWQLTLDRFPLPDFWGGTSMASRPRGILYWTELWKGYEIKLPKPRLVSVTSIKYYDVSNVDQTLATSAYVADTESEPGKIVPAAGTYWPSIQQYRPGSVRVTFVAGSYGDGSDLSKVPPGIVTAILMLTLDIYENPGASAEDLSMTASKLVPASEKFGLYDFENN